MKIVFSNDVENKEFLGRGLDNFNRVFNNNIIAFKDKKEFGFYIYKEGKIIGGVCGSSDMGNWIEVELLYIDQDYRANDLGTKLIDKVEKYAKENNHLGIHLKTWSWQAKGFYEKMGFTKFGELTNHPKDGTMYYMKKELRQA